MDFSRDSRGIDVPESPCAPEGSAEEESEMHSTTIAVDLAKSVVEVAVSERPGKVAARDRLLRGHFSRQPACAPLPAGRRASQLER
jgi:hypothetical protein